jgi:lysophospholipase L1-like esterase
VKALDKSGDATMVKEVSRSRVTAFRVVGKAAFFFVLLNLLFSWGFPLDQLGRLSLYNWLLPGRPRLPYGENPSLSYNVSLDNLPAMMASHIISKEKGQSEYRVVIIGDSGTWGWLLEAQDTLAGQLDGKDLETADGEQVRFYNLGYPIMALSKDLLILEAAVAYKPDLIIWPVTLQSFPRDQQLKAPLVFNNPDRIRDIAEDYDLKLNLREPARDAQGVLARSFVGQRRPLADLLRLQTYGFSWAATGIDQYIPPEIELRSSDFEEDLSWGDVSEPIPLTGEHLALEMIDAGIKIASPIPLMLVNEPIFISQGRNSNLRYNAWYPRWAYDDYRDQLATLADAKNWSYLDLWAAVSPEEFTDSPVHLTPDGVAEMAGLLKRDGIRRGWFSGEEGRLNVAE